MWSKPITIFLRLTSLHLIGCGAPWREDVSLRSCVWETWCRLPCAPAPEARVVTAAIATTAAATLSAVRAVVAARRLEEGPLWGDTRIQPAGAIGKLWGERYHLLLLLATNPSCRFAPGAYHAATPAGAVSSTVPGAAQPGASPGPCWRLLAAYISW